MNQCAHNPNSGKEKGSQVFGGQPSIFDEFQVTWWPATKEKSWWGLTDNVQGCPLASIHIHAYT